MPEQKKTEQKNPEQEWFGEQHVKPGEKYGLVREVFDSVADNYDLMNDLMSAGVHRLWKNRLIRMIHPQPAKKLLDVAGGTGDIAFRYIAKAGEDCDVTVCDINESMLNVGRDRAIDKGYTQGLRWITGNAESLPFEDKSFDVYTISFGLRNVPKIDDALSEAYRVLKPGGRFYCLEFSEMVIPGLNKLYDAYSYSVIPRIGEKVANDRESYQYLVESIRKFPKQEELKSRMEDVGFERCGYENLSGGIAAIHYGWRL